MKAITTTTASPKHQGATTRSQPNVHSRGVLDGLNVRPLAQDGSGFVQRKCGCTAGSLAVNGSGLAVSQPGDQYEQEADRVAAQVMRMPAAAPQLSSSVAAKSDVLQRKCVHCEEEERQLQRQKSGTGPAMVPPIGHEVVGSPGQPLDAATRAFMEPRFGHDFSRVRVHTDTAADRSARSVHALAYTLGADIVFRGDSYRPDTFKGRELIAHELAHTVQQSSQQNSATREAGFYKVHLARQRDDVSAGTSEIHDAGVPGGVPGQPGSAVGAPAASGASSAAAPAVTFVCGPNVTTQVQNVVSALRSAWRGWNSTQREEACWALQNFSCGPVAWDIVELHNNAWIYQDYRPACASAGATPLCGSSVQVGSACHNAGSVNYVIFGMMCSLCDIWRATMHAMIWAHKVHLSGMDPDYGASLRWADAGFDGWPAGSTPAGDRTNCTASCPTAYGPTAHNSSTSFDFNWVPTHTTETTTSECDTAIDMHRNPPQFLPGDLGF
jgi:hypothetical protein